MMNMPRDDSDTGSVIMQHPLQEKGIAMAEPLYDVSSPTTPTSVVPLQQPINNGRVQQNNYYETSTAKKDSTIR
jgi:hypothetical protein